MSADPDAAVAPAEGEPACEMCGNKRVILAVTADGKVTGVKPCPACGVAKAWKGRSMDAYSSAPGRAAVQTFKSFSVIDGGGKRNKSLEVALKAAWSFAKAPQGWLGLMGPTGNGKSHLAAAIYNHARNELGVPAVFITFPDLIASLKALFDKANADAEGETYGQRLRTYQTCELLILDDLGAERQTDWTEGVLFELVDARYRTQLPTVFVSNLDLRDRDQFDGRCVSRWCEAGFSVLVQTYAPDWRVNHGRAEDA